MILRRITEHVKAQNWTAVALDFVIVVVGVLMAFQITSWNEARAERERSQEYLLRIRADLAADIVSLQQHKEVWRQVANEGYAAIAYVEAGAPGDRTPWEILRSFLHASQSWQFHFIDSTYAELRSAGELRLIPDAELRNALADYYVLVAARRGGEGHYHSLPVYREMVRGRVRSDILRYYWRACHRQAPGIQELLDCPPPEGAADISGILEQVTGDAAIVDALRYWVDTQRMAVELAALDVGRAQALIDRIEALQ